MQIDMHFYGVYAMARAAGLDPKTARIIAHASQFVDDATHNPKRVSGNNREGATLKCGYDIRNCLKLASSQSSSNVFTCQKGP